MNIEPRTNYLKEQVAKGDVHPEVLKTLQRIENFIEDGIKSFHPTTSIVIQGRGISSGIAQNFDAFFEMTRELDGEQVAAKVLSEKEKIVGRKLNGTDIMSNELTGILDEKSEEELDKSILELENKMRLESEYIENLKYEFRKTRKI